MVPDRIVSEGTEGGFLGIGGGMGQEVDQGVTGRRELFADVGFGLPDGRDGLEQFAGLEQLTVCDRLVDDIVHSVFLEQFDRMVSESVVQGGEVVGCGDVGPQFEDSVSDASDLKLGAVVVGT